MQYYLDGQLVDKSNLIAKSSIKRMKSCRKRFL